LVHADDPVLHGQIGEDPGAGAAAAAELAGDLDHHADGHFVAAVAGGLEQFVKSGVPKGAMSIDWNEPVALGLECTFAQHGYHRAGAFENLLARRTRRC
jgi:hypothetical protein